MCSSDLMVERHGVVYTCWREFTVRDEASIDWPWVPVCEVRADGAWTDLAFPAEMVSPLWRPALAVDEEGRLVVAWVDNPSGTTASTERVFVKVFRWSADTGWEYVDAAGVGSSFPGAPSLAVSGGAAWVSWASSEMSPNGTSNEPGRYTRHVEVMRLGLGTKGAQSQLRAWRSYATPCPDGVRCREGTATVDTEGNSYLRAELPAIAITGDTIQVAWVAWDTAGSQLLLTESTDAGMTWTTPVRLDGGGRVFGHLAPRIVDGVPYWGRLATSGEAELCRYDGAVACIGLGSERLASFAVTQGHAYATVDTGEGAWAVQEVSW